MTAEVANTPAVPQPEQKPNDKEFNFRQLEAKYTKEIQKEREYRAELEQKVQNLMQQQTKHDDDDDSEPYVDNKKLEKKLTKLNQNTQTDIQKAMEAAKKAAKEEVKRELWLEANPDFFNIVENHAAQFAETNPGLAETILAMPDTFERKKLVYANIKALGLDKPKPKAPSIQEQIDTNRRHYFYQPSGIPNAPFVPQGDFSESGQKAAYQKMQESKKKLRLG